LKLKESAAKLLAFLKHNTGVQPHAIVILELFLSHNFIRNTSHSLAWLVSRERNNGLHVNVCFPDLLSIPFFWDDHRTHIKKVVVDLLNMDDLSAANEITDMALSYYAALGNKTLVGTYVDVSTGN
jgi:hypothetical protein